MAPGELQRTFVAGEGAFVAVEGLDAAAIRALIRAHRDNRDPARVLKRNLGTLVTRVELAAAGLAPDGALPREAVVKEVPVRWRRRLFYRLGAGSSLRREFGKVARLGDLGFRAPRPLACSLRPASVTEVHITEMVEGFAALRDLLWLGERVVRAAPALEDLLARVGAWLRRLHDAGVWQRDMKPSNVLVEEAPASGDGFCLVDITPLRLLQRPLDERRRVRNLAQLLDLTADLDSRAREPLLRAYLGSSAGDLDRWMRPVGQAIEARRDYRQRQCGFRYVDEEHRKSSSSER